MRRRLRILLSFHVALALSALPFINSAGQVAQRSTSGPEARSLSTTADEIPLDDLNTPESEMRGVIERYIVDRGSLTRSYPIALSPARQARFRQFYTDWLAAIQKLNFDAMSQEGKVDYILFKNHLDYELR